ncbi:MAG: BlaI/MecI/CopY family transcriptional regulator [Candidatus Methylarchaceae archaeon HK02M1]|nr:BlaI/MecI/CopY family transcriptional regulator [Candidatus Methylarchaceae archaeon HK01M]MCP8312252.1 BlaI/MecI/CopY family transcriptional regulator [Candidatus Methylarchaceae archaeon HK02M1]
MEGKLSHDKILKIVNMVDLIEGKNEVDQRLTFSLNTQFGRLFNLIEKNFNFGSFTSTDILEAYEDEYNMPIKLSTISTYLQRFMDKGVLVRNRIGIGWSYRRAQSNLQR